jgi:glutamine phosphoribosylpyrophosphate amidotransferase
MFDKFNDECGVFGIYGTPDAAAHTALGLHALQHRGQEAAGIVSNAGGHFYAHRALGLVGDNFSDAAVMSRLQGHAAIGHNRYSTTGETLLRNVQPFYADLALGGFALAHNGNLTNAMTVRRELIGRGSLFASTSDTEVIVHLVALSTALTIEDRITDALKQVEGAIATIRVPRATPKHRPSKLSNRPTLALGLSTLRIRPVMMEITISVVKKMPTAAMPVAITGLPTCGSRYLLTMGKVRNVT